MNDERSSIRSNARGVLHPEEVLQTGRDPGWPILLVVHLRLAAIPEPDTGGSDFMEHFDVQLRFEHWQQIPGSILQLAEAL